MNDELFDRLTARQRECLRLIYTHHSIKEIARLLGLSEDGIKWHLREAREVLGAGRSTEAARMVFGDAPPQTARPEAAPPQAYPLPAYPPQTYAPQTYPPQTYPQRVGPPEVVPSAGRDAILPPFPDHRGGTTDDDALRESRAAYRIEPAATDDGFVLRLPIPTAGRSRNDLTSIEKLGWGLAIGVLAALLLGALASLQHTIL